MDICRENEKTGKMSIDKGSEKKRRLWLVVAVMLLPLLQAGVMAFFSWMRYKAALPVPQWNDEGAYYTLIKTWLATGQPLGYWGFDGGHALVGTGSAWSPAILFPYALFGMMFGWNYSSVFFANLLFLVLAQLLFLLLVQPRRQKLVRMLLLQGLSVIVLLYSVTLMSELLRFSLSIVLAGMLYRLYFKENGRIYRYVVLPSFLLALIQVYIFFVFAIPLYVFGVLRGKSQWNWWKKALLSVAALLLFGGGSYYLLHLISSNYNIYKTENLLKALQAFDLIGVFRSGLAMVKEGLWDFGSCFKTGAGHGLLKWFILFLLLLILLPFGLLCRDVWYFRKEKKTWNIEKEEKKERLDFWGKEHLLYAQVSFGAALFLGAFITVYSLEPFTFFRSLGIVVLFSLYLLLMSDHKWLFPVLLGVYALGMVFLPVNLKDFTAERYPGAGVVQEWKTLEGELEMQIPLKNTENPWENTVALFTLEPKVLASMPPGAGVNMMLYSDKIPEEAEYLFFSKKQENLRPDWLEHDYRAVFEENSILLTEEYRVIWENESYLLYRKK